MLRALPAAARVRTSEPPGAIPVILRQALLGRFNDGPKRALTLVYAPMSFGKTSLLKQFFEDRSANGTAVRLTRSERDIDISHLALQVERAINERASLPGTQRGDAFEHLEELVLSAPFCLFLDEFDAIPKEGIFSFMRELLKRLNENSEIILGRARYRALACLGCGPRAPSFKSLHISSTSVMKRRSVY